MKWHDDEDVTVLEVMQMSADVSGSTVHRRLKSLTSKGMIMLSEDQDDNRVRHISPTSLTLQFFARLDQCLDKALRN
ncbi:MAG: hypothetical protein ACOYNZ_14070 [Rhodoferax sp.]